MYVPLEKTQCPSASAKTQPVEPDRPGKKKRRRLFCLPRFPGRGHRAFWPCQGRFPRQSSTSPESIRSHFVIAPPTLFLCTCIFSPVPQSWKTFECPHSFVSFRFWFSPTSKLPYSEAHVSMCACNIFCFGLGVCALCVFHICSSFAKLYVPGHNMERANNSSKTRRKSSGMKRKCLKQLSERHSLFYLSKSKMLFVPFFSFVFISKVRTSNFTLRVLK